MARKKREPVKIGQLEPAPFGLAGRKAGEQEIVRWVARNVDNPVPIPEECPDPFAWTLLRRCREEPEFVGFFIEKLWVKLIPSRSQLDTDGVGEFDGQPTLDLIKRIEAIRDKAQEKSKPEIPAGFGED